MFSRFISRRSLQLSQRVSSVIVSVDDKSGVATLALSSPPVNTLNQSLLDSLSQELGNIEKSGCRACVLTSAKPGVFSAGLDIMAMFGRNEDQLREYWTSVQNMWLALYMSKVPIIAAINGAAPAGGCMISNSCDYRIMAKHPKFNIGLNETKLGIVAPTWFIDGYVAVIGQREAEYALQLGKLYSGEKALQIGLIDELVEPDQMEQAVESQLKLWLTIPPKALQTTKYLMRNETAQKLINNREKDTNAFVNIVSQEITQKNLGMYIQMMKAKSAKAKTAAKM